MTESTAASSGRIFISYRRQDTLWQADKLYHRLAERFGEDQIFKDVDNIEIGEDFVEKITREVEACTILLALIGERWLDITNEDGIRRLDDPEDFVRLEIEAALERNVLLIPILVDGAAMPRSERLPPSISRLVRRQALDLSLKGFRSDTDNLLVVLESTLAELEKPEPERASVSQDEAEPDSESEHEPKLEAETVSEPEPKPGVDLESESERIPVPASAHKSKRKRSESSDAERIVWTRANVIGVVAVGLFLLFIAATEILTGPTGLLD